MQRIIVGARFGGAHLQKFRFHPRIGERLADCNSRRFGGLVQGGDMRAARAGSDKNKGAAGIDGFVSKLVGKTDRLRGEKTPDRPARQPD